MQALPSRGDETAYLNREPPSTLGGERPVARVDSLAPRTPGLIWVHGLEAGDVMVDGSTRRERLRPLGLSWAAARRREPPSLWEPAGRLLAISDRVGFTGSGQALLLARDRLEGPWPELSEGVKAAPQELAGDRHRRPRMRETLAQRDVVGAVGAASLGGMKRRLI